MPTRWLLSDPVSAATYRFHVNPLSGGSPQYKKHVETQKTTAPVGNVLRYEGAPEPMQASVSGSILELAHYQALVTWFKKRYPVTLTDDFGRVQTIYITEFRPTRQRSGKRRYRHEFTMNYIIAAVTDLDGIAPEVPPTGIASWSDVTGTWAAQTATWSAI